MVFLSSFVMVGQIVCFISGSDNHCASLAALSSESLGTLKLSLKGKNRQNDFLNNFLSFCVCVCVCVCVCGVCVCV